MDSLKQRVKVRMNWTRQTEHFRDALATSESRFEQPDIGPLCETAAQAHFGGKLQKCFPLPPENSEPEHIRALLREIQAKFDESPVAADAPEIGRRRRLGLLEQAN
jgi:hypothetical protein